MQENGIDTRSYDPEINFYQEIPHCPKRLYYEYISKEIKSVPTEAQMKGLIFENMLLGAFFSMFPDFLTLLYWKGGLKFLKKPFDFHAWVHPYPPFAPEREWNLKNALNDIIISILAIILLII